jgi:hypothetical protein
LKWQRGKLTNSRREHCEGDRRNSPLKCARHFDSVLRNKINLYGE